MPQPNIAHGYIKPDNTLQVVEANRIQFPSCRSRVLINKPVSSHLKELYVHQDPENGSLCVPGRAVTGNPLMCHLMSTNCKCIFLWSLNTSWGLKTGHIKEKEAAQRPSILRSIPKEMRTCRSLQNQPTTDQLNSTVHKSQTPERESIDSLWNGNFPRRIS